eukprot:4009275-Pleurochrysis_carterae.AAC.3
MKLQSGGSHTIIAHSSHYAHLVQTAAGSPRAQRLVPSAAKDSTYLFDWLHEAAQPNVISAALFMQYCTCLESAVSTRGSERCLPPPLRSPSARVVVCCSRLHYD